MADLSSGLSYLGSGVDVEEGNRFARETLEPLARYTHEKSRVANSRQNGAQNGALNGAEITHDNSLHESAGNFLGGFGASLDLRGAGFRDPIIELACDGVGTKLRLAIDAGKFSGLGIDLVAMCVNDLLSKGARPLAFLDYIGYANFADGVQAELMKSIAEGCVLAGCTLVGGESAQMPGFYKTGDFDLAGFALGAIERDAPFRERRPEIGDKLFAVPSSGFHANGFSLVRAVLDKNPSLKNDAGLLENLLRPTFIYSKFFAPLIAGDLLSGIAHITGGGIGDNLPRILRVGQKARIDLNKFPRPEVFTTIQRAGSISEREMRRVFNCGIGVIVAVSPCKVESFCAAVSGIDVLPEAKAMVEMVDIGEIEEASADGARKPHAYFSDDR